MMMVSSFDIFDTCLVRKCGTPENFFDVLSLRVFNGEIEEWARQEFAAARYLAQKSVQSPSMTLQDIWDAFDWKHPQLKQKDDLIALEQQLEREMLVPVLSMRDKVNECRNKGQHIIFISDMYLPSEFLRDVMHESGFLHDGDSLYVSCECGVEKWGGELFKYVRDKENLSFRHWHHYGDHLIADYKAPRKLGIRATLINHEYTPYQLEWKDNDYTLGFKFPSILAGLGRALHHSNEWTTHTDFVLDIIAPFYCSLVYQMMKDAEQRGIQRLYFCARDAYPLYRIALKYADLFPQLRSNYLYISRQSLYEGEDKAKLQYFIQEGLATTTDNVAIVDVRSQGKTQRFLSDYLMERGYKEVFGYFFEMFTLREQLYHNPYFCKANGAYLTMNNNLSRYLLSHWQLYEDFFSLNDSLKTIDYKIDNDKSIPVFSEITDHEDNFQNEKSYWAGVHNLILENYAAEYIRCGLVRYSGQIFESISIPTLAKFLRCPRKVYLKALTGFSSYLSEQQTFVPFVKHLTIVDLLMQKGRKGNMWRIASLVYTLPEWLAHMIVNIVFKYRNTH